MKIVLSLVLMFAFAVTPALAEEHAAKDEAPAEEGAEGAAKPADPAENYINLQPMILPVLGDKGPEQLVTIVVSLELVDPEKADFVKSRIPRLNDAYLQTLYGALDTRSINKGSLVDIGRVKQRLQAPTKRVLGDDVVKEILVQAVAQRRY